MILNTVYTAIGICHARAHKKQLQRRKGQTGGNTENEIGPHLWIVSKAPRTLRTRQSTNRQ